MFLDLHDIIEVPGGQKPFRCELDRERLSFPALVSFHGPVTASGAVKNTAGILELTADVEADMTVRGDRCSAEDDYADLFPLEGDGVDVSDVLETCFILGMDLKFLCRDDCKGLCPDCGKNLNDGPCGCGKQTDPRMAALAQLLDDIQEV